MISVVIPTHNRANLIERSVQSVLDQQCSEPIEVLVVDDASDDDTAVRVNAINDTRVRLITLPQKGGACAARNAGIMHAQGEWIAFQDSDDEWLAGKLEAQLSVFQSSGADLVFTRFYRCDDTGSDWQLFPHDVTEEGVVTYEQLLFENLASTQTIMANRKVMRDLMFDERYPRLQDWEMVLRAAQKYKLVYIKQPYVRVYMQPDSLSKHPERALAAQRMLLKQHRAAIVKNNAVCRQWLAALTQAANACGHSAAADCLRLVSFEQSWLVNVEAFARAGREMLRSIRRRLSKP